MKIVRIMLVLLAFPLFSYAGERGSADYYLSDPEGYLNKRVSIYISSVDVPAINSSSEEDDFRIFLINTMGQASGEYSHGGYIYMMVPKSDGAAFVKRHNKSTASAPKSVSGTFKKWDRATKYTTPFSYYIDCTK